MINIIGLGYIGLPTVLMFAKSGVKVAGTDYNEKMSCASNLYGDGFASKRIADVLEQY
ncbi:MAG: hypothetical protein K8S00_03395 [Bacteroidales bacterium]|nr:hypothetical protein [Bacteroidales bacterium]